jgi:hypothetical protein
VGKPGPIPIWPPINEQDGSGKPITLVVNDEFHWKPLREKARRTGFRSVSEYVRKLIEKDLYGREVTPDDKVPPELVA